MRVTMEIPAVKTCGVSECVYNHDTACNARAITIGDGSWPLCDTNFVAEEHTKTSHQAGVGACKVVDCKFNRDYDCQADNIVVGRIKDKAQCSTFQHLTR